MRRDRGRLNGGAITYAPDTLRDGDSYIIAPRDEDYARLRWLPIVDEPPTTAPREGFHWERTRPVEESGEILWQYAEVADPPPPPRTFRKSWLAQWMYANDKWAALQAFLADPDNEALAFMWGVCTEFDEDDAGWPKALAAIKAALQLTDADADNMLAYGATGGQP